MKPILMDPAWSRVPSGSCISKTDEAMRKTSLGLCLGSECIRLADGDDGLCKWCREDSK